MKIRTLEQLEDRLYSEFAWRRDELRTIAADFAPAVQFVSTARVRAGITVLYAHWEGGVKEMADAYLSYIKNQSARYVQLQAGILGLLLRARLKELEASSRFLRNRAVCEDVLQRLTEQAKFPAGSSVETGSNLNSERLVDILVGVGVEEHLFSTKHALIDNLLLARNDAAHGDRVKLDRSDFLRFYPPIMDALELLRDRLIQAGQQQHFLATVA